MKRTKRKWVTPELVCSGRPKDPFNSRRKLIDPGGSNGGVVIFEHQFFKDQHYHTFFEFP